VRLLLIIAALAAPALLASPAQATPTLDGRRTGFLNLFRTITYANTSAAQANAITVSRDSGTGEIVFRPSDTGTNWTVTGDACTEIGTTTEVRCSPGLGVALTATGGDARDVMSAGSLTFGVTLVGGGGGDSLSGGSGSDLLDGGSGRDTLTGNDGNDVLDGGDDADSLNAGAGDDTLQGGGGRDTLRPGTGADQVHGGEGFDVATYSERTQPLTITLDDQPGDGEAGEGDDVRGDVEDVLGGSGPDTLTGNAADNVLAGGDGADRIDGGTGIDTYAAGDGDDVLVARDGNREQVDCGGGADHATGDLIDDHIECETIEVSAALVADLDGDGVRKPGDCNDTNAAIRPGAPEIADNSVDENCDGADLVNLDRDGDGVPRPLDCDDANAAIRPGSREVRGNRADEDCSGLADPFARISSPVSFAHTVLHRRTRFTRLTVRRVPRATRVELRCLGGKRRGCPRQLRRERGSVRRGRASFTRGLRRVRLRAGARLEVRLTRPGVIGKVVRFRIRARSLPLSSTLCLQPNARRTSEC
jgi:Ca2+-binding RTX toxin-like protein